MSFDLRHRASVDYLWEPAQTVFNVSYVIYSMFSSISGTQNGLNAVEEYHREFMPFHDFIWSFIELLSFVERKGCYILFSSACNNLD